MNANIMNTQILLSMTSTAIEGHQKVKKGYFVIKTLVFNSNFTDF